MNSHSFELRGARTQGPRLPQVSTCGMHNRDWAEKMRCIGLDPADTPETGEHKRLHAPDGGDGPFTLACRKLPCKLKWEACRRCRRNSYLSGGVSMCAACERICAARESQLLLNFINHQ